MTSASDLPPNTVGPSGGRASEMGWTVGVGAVAFGLYLATLCPTVYTLDAPELTAVAGTWGVAHPPGYPLFALLYGALAHAVPIGDLALRTNVVTALLAATAVALFFRGGRALGASRPAAAAGALGVAVARDWWAQGISTEVYALDGLLLAASFLATARVAREPRATGPWAWLGLWYGLACGHRAVNVVFLTALLGWAEWSRRRDGVPIGRYGRFGAAGIATAAIWLYLPLAASFGPSMNMGDPSDAGRLWIVLTAAPYARHLASTEWGFVFGRIAQYGPAIPLQLGATAIAAVCGGVLLHRRGAGAAAWSIAAFAALNLTFVFVYNVPDGESFLQPMWVVAAVLAAVGYDALRGRLGNAGGPVVVGLALLPALWTFHHNDLSGVRTVETYGRDLLDSAEPGSLVLASDDTARNAMVFQQVVRGYRTDVAAVDMTAALDWHLEETQRRAPGFDTAGVSGEGWVGALASRMLRDGRFAVYVTRAENLDLTPLLGPALAQRVAWTPTGLLYRLLLAPRRGETTRVAAAAGASFWPGHSIPFTPRARRDPQLAAITVRVARARFLLAVTHVLAGDVDSAVPHLEALTAHDLDALEDAVVADLASIGTAPSSWRIGRRAAKALEGIRRGAPQPEVARALAPE